MEVALAEHEAAILKSQQEREERRQREHEASRKALQEEYDNAVLLLREDMSRERERWRKIRAEHGVNRVGLGRTAEDVAESDAAWERSQDEALANALQDLRSFFAEVARIRGVEINFDSDE